MSEGRQVEVQHDPRFQRALLQLAQADDDQFRQALTHYLLVNHSAALSAVLHHPALRGRTVRTLSWLLRQADKRDRAGQPVDERRRWQAIRNAARAERQTINELPEPVDADASPRRRALQRLAEEFQPEWARLVQAAGGNPKKVSLRRLAALHQERFATLRREERDKQGD
ncbi:hypothetical protein OOJ91_33880 [Micromonospora lupini]|uniref:hypothetical protein n=1 Tax=Micromonospora lupini TaxID=285679 RepID=UPI002254CA8D|nr:hypothetical protein [Micromonospora lupini]MCX5070838.1 hypothetical protein [Micromonospora lupini]